ncbi:MAG: hypothetical protein IJN02_07025 [Bacteroidales bacterium]|nr:hypothetical protein [Bacteroidales bacterium]
MKRINILTTMLATAAMAFISCDKNEDTPVTPQEQPATTEQNIITINDQKIAFKSAAAGMFMEYPIIAATPVEGLSTYEDIISEEDVFYIFLAQDLIGKEFDLMKETKDFGLYISYGEDIYVEFSSDYKEGVKDGSATVTNVNGTMSATVTLTLTDDTQIRLNATAAAPAIEENENTISWNNDEKPLRAAFYTQENGLTVLYFTPGNINWFEEIYDATYYVAIAVQTKLCDGTDIDAEDLMYAFYEDAYGKIVESYEVNTTGTVNILTDESDPTYYKVSANLDFAGETLAISYEGNAVSTKDKAPEEVKPNQYTLDGNTVALAYAVLNQTFGDLWMLELYPEEGTAVRITMPKTFYDGNAHGFSQSEDMNVKIGSRTFSKANGDSGTVTVSVNEDRGEIEASFTDYAGCNVYFKGGASIVK